MNGQTKTDFKQWEDGELIEATQQGQLSAFDELVRRYRRRVYAVAFQMTYNKEDADDLSQETFLRAYNAIASFKKGYKFYTWLYRIVVNLAINLMKKRKPLNYEDYPGMLETHGSEEYNPSKTAQNEETLRKVRRALEQLSPVYKSVFVLRVFQGLSYQEISEALEISKGTVMSRLNRARTKLQTLLIEYA